jgi:hypothetical protein
VAVVVTVRFLSNAQHEQLSRFPAEIDDETLDRFSCAAVPTGPRPASAVATITDRAGRCGCAGCGCWGFAPDDVTMAPACRPDTLVFSPLMLLPGHRPPGDHYSGHWRAAGSLWVLWPLGPRQGWGHG